ncbi:hypothetical protein HDU76_002696 [Blyttiomyces sp. JEL0837]|nr:hypothetical protein HDU76_002696 [Blyttiomyces sp. JEL0837]
MISTNAIIAPSGATTPSTITTTPPSTIPPPGGPTTVVPSSSSTSNSVTNSLSNIASGSLTALNSSYGSSGSIVVMSQPEAQMDKRARVEMQMLREVIANGDLYECKKIISKKRLPLQFPDPMNGWPLLFYAIKYGQNEIVNWLLESGHEAEGISKDFNGNTALMIACEYRNEPLLLDYGADVNSSDREGSTPLHFAMAFGHFDTTTLLMERGAHPSPKNLRGWTPGDYAYSLEILDHLEECVAALSENRPIRPPPPPGPPRPLLSIPIGGSPGVNMINSASIAGGSISSSTSSSGSGPGSVVERGSGSGSGGQPRLDLRTFF